MMRCSVTSTDPSALTISRAPKSRILMKRSCAPASVPSETTSVAMTRSARAPVIIIERMREIALLEGDLRQLAVSGRRLEELELIVTHRSGNEVRGDRRHRRVEVAYDGVVIPAGVLDGIFRRREL